MGWFLWSQIGRKVHGTISLRNPWSEVWDVISWHQNRNTQVIEERTNRRPPDRKKYDTLTWGPTGRKEDLDNVTKEKERERERQRKELQIYMHNIATKSRDKGAALSFYLCTKDILVSLITSMILKTYLCTHLFALPVWSKPSGKDCYWWEDASVHTTYCCIQMRTAIFI